MKAIQVENVKSKSKLNNLIRFPWNVLRNDPYRVPLVFGKEKS